MAVKFQEHDEVLDPDWDLMGEVVHYPPLGSSGTSPKLSEEREETVDPDEKLRLFDGQ